MHITKQRRTLKIHNLYLLPIQRHGTRIRGQMKDGGAAGRRRPCADRLKSTNTNSISRRQMRGHSHGGRKRGKGSGSCFYRGWCRGWCRRRGCRHRGVQCTQHAEYGAGCDVDEKSRAQMHDCHWQCRRRIARTLREKAETLSCVLANGFGLCGSGALPTGGSSKDALGVRALQV